MKRLFNAITWNAVQTLLLLLGVAQRAHGASGEGQAYAGIV